MEVLELSRLQFAFTAMIHFIFVPLTLGLSVLVAYMETKYVRTGDEMYLRMTKFWGKLFLINFAMGVVTGLTLAFEFGMNWSAFASFAGDIFGAPLAAESMTAFFLESTFIGIWIFGWKKINKKVHATTMWLVAFATNLSGLWILLANGWMQAPVGFNIVDGEAQLVSFAALFTNPVGWIKFGHTILAGYILAAFFVMGISAYHLLRKQNIEFFKRSFRIAAGLGLGAALIVPLLGDMHGTEIAHKQPSKLAAIEAHWETDTQVPYTLLTFPDEKNERNYFEALKVPYGMSLLLFKDPNAEVVGLKDFPPEDRPPVWPVFTAFRVMVGLGILFVLLTATAVYLSRKDKLMDIPIFLKVMMLAIPLPYIAIQSGWIVAEVGRQPWVVYGVMRTAEGVSPVLTAPMVMFSLAGFVVLYLTLLALDIFLLQKYARLGPDESVEKLIDTRNPQPAGEGKDDS